MKSLLYIRDPNLLDIILISHTKMTITQQQTFNPSFSNPDDMPEYVSIYEMKPKRKSGRPRTCTLTDEQKKERQRKITAAWRENNYEYARLQSKILTAKKRESAK